MGYKTITIQIEEETWEEITRISKKRKISKASLYRMMIELGVDCHKDLERVGIVPVIDFVHFVKKSVKEKSSSPGQQLNLI